MARYRSRSRSYSPHRRSRTPPRGRKRYDDEPRDRYRDSRSYRDRRSPGPCGLLVRNLPLNARPEDLRVPFERYGAVKDVYLPKNYYTRQPRGFGFVKFRYAEHAAEAKQQLNHTVIGGREITIVFAEENRKTPQEMRKIGRMSGTGRYGGSGRRRTPTRSPRRRYQSYSRSPSPARDDSREGKNRDDYHSPERYRSYSRSPSPRGEREKDYRRSPSPRENGQSRNGKRDRTPIRSESPKRNSHSPSRSRPRSYSTR